MAEKALYILAGYDDQTEAYLAGIQKKLYEQGFSGTQTKDIPMHITMGSYPVEMETELKKRIVKLSTVQRAINVTFSHTGIFRLPTSDVLFIAPDVNREMLDLKEEFKDSMDKFVWTPHTTMLIDSPNIIHKAIPNVLKEFSPFAGRVAVLHMYEFWPTRHIMSVPLQT